MANYLETINSSEKSIRSFWERKEGSVGMVVIGASVLAVVFLGNALLPSIITFLGLAIAATSKAIVLASLMAALAAAGFIVTNKRVQLLVSYSFKVIMRKFTNVFVATYPIEIMQEVISVMVKKKAVFGERKSDVKKTERSIEETVKDNERQRQEALAKVRAAQKRNDLAKEVILYSREAGKLEEVNQRHLASLAQVKDLYSRLVRIDDMLDFKIKDMQTDVKLLKQTNDMAKATRGALAAAGALLKGSSDMELYDAASEYVIDDYRNTIGALDDFMSGTESIMNGIDLTNGMWQEKAMEQLALLDSKEQILLSGSSSNHVIRPIIEANVQMAVPLPSSDYDAKYFK